MSGSEVYRPPATGLNNITYFLLVLATKGHFPAFQFFLPWKMDIEYVYIFANADLNSVIL